MSYIAESTLILHVALLLAYEQTYHSVAIYWWSHHLHSIFDLSGCLDLAPSKYLVFDKQNNNPALLRLVLNLMISMSRSNHYTRTNQAIYDICVLCNDLLISLFSFQYVL